MSLRTLFLCVLLFVAVPLSAQTVINPTRAEFQASADHSATKLDGSAVLTSYELNAVAMNGAGALALTVNLGKPTPDATGKIVVTVPQFSTLTANTLYTATVTAKGPDGAGVSTPSSPFGRSVPLAPAAPGRPVLLP